MNLFQIIISILSILIIVIYISWLLYKKGLKTVIRHLIVEAERLLEDNRDKFNTVVNGVLVSLPIPFNLIPISFIERLVQKVFDEIKEALDFRPEIKEG